MDWPISTRRDEWTGPFLPICCCQILLFRKLLDTMGRISSLRSLGGAFFPSQFFKDKINRFISNFRGEAFNTGTLIILGKIR